MGINEESLLRALQDMHGREVDVVSREENAAIGEVLENLPEHIASYEIDGVNFGDVLAALRRRENVGNAAVDLSTEEVPVARTNYQSGPYRLLVFLDSSGALDLIPRIRSSAGVTAHGVLHDRALLALHSQDGEVRTFPIRKAMDMASLTYKDIGPGPYKVKLQPK